MESLPRPLAHLSDEELRAALRAQPERPPPSQLQGWGAVVEWALKFGVFPGRTRAIEAVDLYRHFIEAGYSLGRGYTPVFWEFGICLNRLGLRKGRLRTGGVDQRPRLMTEDAGLYFRAWLCERPRPAGGQCFNDFRREKRTAL